MLFSNILNQSSFLIAFQLRRMDFFSSSKVLQYQNPVHNDKARNSESQRKCQRKQCDIKQNILPLNKPFIPSPFLTHILAYHNTELHRFFFFLSEIHYAFMVNMPGIAETRLFGSHMAQSVFSSRYSR